MSVADYFQLRISSTEDAKRGARPLPRHKNISTLAAILHDERSRRRGPAFRFHAKRKSYWPALSQKIPERRFQTGADLARGARRPDGTGFSEMEAASHCLRLPSRDHGLGLSAR